jgi:RNA polymerase sigma-70 factor (sigma-E family)
VRVVPAPDGESEGVYREVERRAYRLAVMLTRDHHDALDVAADAIARVWPRWARGELDDPAAYVRTAVLNEVRARARRRTVEQRWWARWSAAEGRRVAPGFVDGVVDRDALLQALDRLPPRQRAVIVLRYYEDLSEAATADTLGMSVGSVKSQASRGLARLRDLLGDRA